MIIFFTKQQTRKEVYFSVYAILVVLKDSNFSLGVSHEKIY